VILLSLGDAKFIPHTPLGRIVVSRAQTQGWLADVLPFGASHPDSKKINRDCGSRDLDSRVFVGDT